MAVDQLGLRGAAMPATMGAMSMSMDGPETKCMPESAMPAAPAGAAPAQEERARRVSRKDMVREEVGAVPPPPSKPVAKKSFLGRLFGGGGAADDAAHASESSPPPVLAKLLLRTAGEWLFELTGLAAWDAPTRVVVVLDDGSEHELRVEAARTTANGPLAAGALVRLVLLAALAGAALPAGTPVRLRLVLAGATLDVPIA
jgi:hypothetical protein